MKIDRVVVWPLPVLAVACLCALERPLYAVDFEEVKFPSADGVAITGDLYVQHGKQSPFIVLCHQAGWSRGEYREIAPKLNKLGFNCVAIDQRSGGQVNEVANQTHQAANQAGKPTQFTDAEQDIVAAVQWARKNYASGKLLLWGSSYSAALTLRIAGEHADKIDGALAFAPGEYFQRLGKPADWIAKSAKKIADPVFITSAKNEWNNWKTIYAAVPGKDKVKFLPETPGNHGSRALWEQFGDSDQYWTAAREFLKQYQSRSSN